MTRDNARRRLAATLLFLALLGCLAGAYLGGKAVRGVMDSEAAAVRFWERSIPIPLLARLSGPERVAAHKDLKRQLGELGHPAGSALVLALDGCLGVETKAEAACSRAGGLVRAAGQRVHDRWILRGYTAAGLHLGAALGALVLGLFLFRLSGRASGLVLVLSLMLFGAGAALRVAEQLERRERTEQVAGVDRFVLEVQLGLKAPAAKGGARTLPRPGALPSVQDPRRSRELARALTRCERSRTACPRVLPALARHRDAALSSLRPVRSRQRFAGWLELSALLLCLLVPLMGAVSRRP